MNPRVTLQVVIFLCLLVPVCVCHQPTPAAADPSSWTTNYSGSSCFGLTQSDKDALEYEVGFGQWYVYNADTSSGHWAACPIVRRKGDPNNPFQLHVDVHDPTDGEGDNITCIYFASSADHSVYEYGLGTSSGIPGGDGLCGESGDFDLGVNPWHDSWVHYFLVWLPAYDVSLDRGYRLYTIEAFEAGDPP